MFLPSEWFLQTINISFSKEKRVKRKTNLFFIFLVLSNTIHLYRSTDREKIASCKNTKLIDNNMHIISRELKENYSIT